MAELVIRVGHLETGMEGMREDVAEMKPVTDDSKRWKLMGSMLSGVIGVAGWCAVAPVADAMAW